MVRAYVVTFFMLITYFEWKSYRNLTFLVETMLSYGNEVINLEIACCKKSDVF